MNDKKRENIITILLTLVMGTIIHGAYAFDKTIWFDDAAAVGAGWTTWGLQRGRWSYEAVNYLLIKFIGREMIASWHIINSLILIAFVAIILLKKLGINNNSFKLVLIVYMIVNTTVLGNFGYGSCAMNFLGILITTVASVKVVDGISEGKK